MGMFSRTITVFGAVAIAACSADAEGPVPEANPAPVAQGEQGELGDEELSSEPPPSQIEIAETENSASLFSPGEGTLVDGVEVSDDELALAAATPLEASGNLLKVPGFERAGAWSLHEKVAERVTGGAYRGDFSLRTDSHPRIRVFASQTVPAEYGFVYSLYVHLDIRERSPANEAQMFSLELLDRDGKRTRWCGSYSGNVLIRQKWQYSGVIQCKAPEGTAKARVRIYQSAPGSGVGRVKWDAMSVKAEACIPKGRVCDRVLGANYPIECARCCGRYENTGADAQGYNYYSCK